MKSNKIIFSLIISLLFLIKVNAANYSFGQKTQTFKVSKGGVLKVSLDYGDVKISTWDKSEVFVKYEQDNDDSNPLKISQSGNKITITSHDYDTEYSDLEITIPTEFNLDIKTQAGDIIVENNIKGKAEISTAGGEITLQNVDGEVYLNTAGGDIKTGKISGDAKINSAGGELKIGLVGGKSSINTSGGDINVFGTKSSIKANSGGGNINIGDVDGEAEVATGGGNITLGNVKKYVNASTGGGEIDVNNAEGKIKISTGGGNINLKNITGSIKAVTGGGNISVSLNPSLDSDSKIITGYGNLSLSIPSNSKVKIIAEVSGIGWMSSSENLEDVINSDYKAQNIEKDKDRGKIKATYILNGGGSTVHLVTSSGTIEIVNPNKK